MRIFALSSGGSLGLMRVLMPACGGMTFSRNIISDLMSPVTPAAYKINQVSLVDRQGKMGPKQT